MGKDAINDSGLMIPAGAISSIGAATEIVNVTDYDSLDLDVSGVDRIVFQCEAKGGNASASGTVDFNFAASLDKSTFDTDPILTITVTMSGVAVIRGTEGLDVRGIHILRLISIENKDASYAATLVQCRWGKT